MLTTRPKVVEIINYNIYKYYGETWIINQNGEVHYESLKGKLLHRYGSKYENELL